MKHAKGGPTGPDQCHPLARSPAEVTEATQTLLRLVRTASRIKIGSRAADEDQRGPSHAPR